MAVSVVCGCHHSLTSGVPKLKAFASHSSSIAWKFTRRTFNETELYNMELDRKIRVNERKRMQGHCKILRFILPKDFFNRLMPYLLCSAA